MESSNGMILFLAPLTMSSTTHTTYSNFNIDTIWADIERIFIPQMNTIQPKITISSVVAPSLDAKQSISSMNDEKIFSALGAIAAAIAWYCVPAFFICWLFIIFFCVSKFFNNSINISEWINRYKKADNAFNEALVAWQKQFGVMKIYEIRASLESAANEFRSLAALKSQTVSDLMKERHNNQLINYLDRYLLSSATIPGIGHARKVVLASFGIESAADIKKSEIMKIPGFGEAITAKLLEWRADLASKCVYNSKISSADTEARAKVENEFNNKASVLMKRLSSGGTELRQAVIQVQERTKTSDNTLNQLAIERAQIEVDLQFLGIPKPAGTSKQTGSFATVPKSTSNLPQKTPPSIPNPMKCRQCGSKMIRRTANLRPGVTYSIWECSAYPLSHAKR
jgi:hypothetical protein